MRIERSVLEAIRAVAERAYPHEGCGLLVGDAGPDGEAFVRRHLPVDNQSVEQGTSRNRYLIAPGDFLKAERAVTGEGLQIVGIYHSHPEAPAKPSAYDREHAWPWYRYLIVSVSRGTAGEARAWELVDDRSEFVEHTVAVEDSN
ncbi:MAG: M67 family metallopeptidase [Gemmatimonadetes bacterium]|nr:M67 family metallopeptidase [Gemmatimonadota bacterium]